MAKKSPGLIIPPSSKLSAIRDRFIDFINTKKQQVVSNVETNSAVVFVLKWLLTHWVTVTLALIIGFFAIRYHLIQEDLREAQLNEELHALNIDLDKMKQERAMFLARIKDLQNVKKTNQIENKKVKESASNLDSEGKKKLLLEYKTRLMGKRRL